MTTITSSGGTTEVVSARRTESRDVSDIIELFNDFTDAVFGRIDVMYLLEKSNLALTLCNEKNEVIAHAAFLDYPNWNITDQSDWESFLRENYINDKCTPLNTLFMHLFVAKEGYAAGCSQEIFRRVFITVPELQFILLFIPADENLEPDIGNVFEKMMTAPGSVVDKKFTLLVCLRHWYHPQLYVRQARTSGLLGVAEKIIFLLSCHLFRCVQFGAKINDTLTRCAFKHSLALVLGFQP